MNSGLWILLCIVAACFLVHTSIYLFVPPFAATMINGMGISPWFRRFIGVVEALAVVGIVLPGLPGILPGLRQGLPD